MGHSSSLIAARERAGISQAVLAQRTGLSPSTIARYEQGGAITEANLARVLAACWPVARAADAPAFAPGAARLVDETIALALAEPDPGDRAWSLGERTFVSPAVLLEFAGDGAVGVPDGAGLDDPDDEPEERLARGERWTGSELPEMLFHFSQLDKPLSSERGASGAWTDDWIHVGSRAAAAARCAEKLAHADDYEWDRHSGGLHVVQVRGAVGPVVSDEEANEISARGEVQGPGSRVAVWPYRNGREDPEHLSFLVHASALKTLAVVETDDLVDLLQLETPVSA